MKTITVTDAGEELKFNRRNRDRGLTWEDAQAMPGALRATSVKKAAVWPRPDYAKLIETGMHPLGARILKQAYDAIAASPSKADDASLQDYIAAVTKVRETIEPWAKDRKNIQSFTQSATAAFSGLMSTQQAENRALSGQAVDILSLVTPSSAAQATARVLLNLLWPLPPGTSNRFPRGSVAYNELFALGGNRALTKLQIGYDDIKRMINDLSEGWPAKREAWQIQGYQVLKIVDTQVRPMTRRDGFTVMLTLANGKNVSSDIFETEAAATAHREGLSTFGLFDKYNRLLMSFESEDAAREHARSLVSTRNSIWAPEPLPIDQLKRSGPAWREVDNVTPQQVMETFGFRGINFGNWVPNEERQKLLNASFDSWADLADIMGTPTTTIGRQGTLGYAIGAQGSGSHAGHFVPGLNEINSTRFAGGGVLAHEWGHFLDHLLAFLVCDARKEDAYISSIVQRPRELQNIKTAHPQHAEWLDAFANVMRVLKQRVETPEEVHNRTSNALAKYQKYAKSWTSDMKIPEAMAALQDQPEQRAKLEALVHAAVSDGARADSPHRCIGRTKSHHNAVPECVAEIWDICSKACARALPTGPYKNFSLNLYSIANQRSDQANPTPKITDTDYLAQSKRMDGNKGGETYWSTNEELFARAFADWVRIKLQDRGQINEHLSSDLHASYAAAQAMGLIDANPFLHGEELAAAVQAIDKLTSLMPIERLSNSENMLHANIDTNDTPEQGYLFERQ